MTEFTESSPVSDDSGLAQASAFAEAPADQSADGSVFTSLRGDTPVPGACYKFTVKSAEEAATLIRERLGPGARVLTVRAIEATGLSRWWTAPSLEVIAQLEAPAEETPPAAGGHAAGLAPSQQSVPPGRETDETSLPTAESPAITKRASGQAAGRPDDPAPVDSFSARPHGTSSPSPRPRLARVSPTLPDLLRRSGLSEMALGRLQETPVWSGLTAAPLHRALAEIGRHLQDESARRWARAPLGRAAFLGTSGVGRTTALCKWLGIEVFRRSRSGHVIMAEFDRPNSPGALPVFCEALGVPVARHPASTQPATPGGFVYFDLPGISLRDPADNSAVAAFLARERIAQRVLVLNAAYDHAALRAAYTAGRALGATHLVFTHLDEAPQWGKLWDYLLDGALEPLFLATGPSLTGDCEEDVFGTLVRRTLAGQHESPAATEELPAQSAPAFPLKRAASFHP